MKNYLEKCFENDQSQVLKIASREAMSITGCRKPDSLNNIMEKVSLYFDISFYYKKYECIYFVVTVTDEDKACKSLVTTDIDFFVYKYLLHMSKIDARMVANFFCFDSLDEFMEIATRLQKIGLIRIEKTKNDIQLIPYNSTKHKQEVPKQPVNNLEVKLNNMNTNFSNALNAIVDEIELLAQNLFSLTQELDGLKMLTKKLEEDERDITEKYRALEEEFNTLKFSTTSTTEHLPKLNTHRDDTISTASRQGGIKYDQNKLEQLRKIIKLN